MLLSVPIGISRTGCGTVTRPGFTGCLNCFWLPTCATSYQPSCFKHGISGPVKTPASQRWMPLDRSLAKKLRQHQLRSASPVNAEGWIFANPDTGQPYWPGRIQENWLVPAAGKEGLGWIGWHTFRHSHSSLLHALGVDLKVQQELLRHADIRTTMNIYTHAVPAALREANSKVVHLVLSAQVAWAQCSLKLPRKSVTDC